MSENNNGFRDRLSVEKSELISKVTKLEDFISVPSTSSEKSVFSLLDSYSQLLLRQQAEVMRDYLVILRVRIDRIDELKEGE